MLNETAKNLLLFDQLSELVKSYISTGCVEINDLSTNKMGVIPRKFKHYQCLKHLYLNSKEQIFTDDNHLSRTYISTRCVEINDLSTSKMGKIPAVNLNIVSI